MPFLPCKRYHRHVGGKNRRRSAKRDGAPTHGGATGQGAGVAAGGSRPVTIRDVAALSGVSIATVTRTFQGSPQVRPETSARVLASAERLGYRPDSIARALVTGTSNTIGVLIRSLVEPYWAEIADTIEQRASEHGYSVLLASSAKGALSASGRCSRRSSASAWTA